MIGIFILVLTLSALGSSQVDPPTWPNHFSQVFVQTYDSTHLHVSGQIHYDADRNMQRIDRTDGKFEMICGSVQPNISTACTQLVRDDKTYLIFPERRVCCMCCDAAHGCGILKRDWLKEAKYQGNQTISGESFYKWSIPDGNLTDLYWATKTDQRIPRKMNIGTLRSKDFIMNTYTEEAIPDHVFALPSYCNQTCSPTTVCGKFQSSQQILVS